MKKFFSIFLVLSFITAPICNNCFSISPEEASLQQLLNAELLAEEKLSSQLCEDDVVYYQTLKEKVMDEISKRDINTIAATAQDNLAEISRLEENLEILKQSKSTLYSSVEDANSKIEKAKSIQEILQKELYKRMPWSTYLFKKFLNVTGSALTGATAGSVIGTVAATVFAPFSGFNSKLILQFALNNAISSSISSALSDISNKCDGAFAPIINLITTISSIAIVNKILPQNPPSTPAN